MTRFWWRFHFRRILRAVGNLFGTLSRMHETPSTLAAQPVGRTALPACDSLSKSGGRLSRKTRDQRTCICEPSRKCARGRQETVVLFGSGKGYSRQDSRL